MTDPNFRTVSLPLSSKGICAHFALDAVPEGMYLNLENTESRQEEAISSGFGTKLFTVKEPRSFTIAATRMAPADPPIPGMLVYWTYITFRAPHDFTVGETVVPMGCTNAPWLNGNHYTITAVTDLTIRFDERVNLIGYDLADTGVVSRLGYNSSLPAAVHTLARLKGVSQSYRYAAAANSLFRGTGDEPYNLSHAISTVLSGQRFTFAEYRPSPSADPYLFIADRSVLLKDNGLITSAWGIFPPTTPAKSSIGQGQSTVADTFDTMDGLAIEASADFTPSTITVQLESVVAPGLQTVSMPGDASRGVPVLGPALFAAVDSNLRRTSPPFTFEFVEHWDATALYGPTAHYDVYRPWTTDLAARGNLANWISLHNVVEVVKQANPFDSSKCTTGVYYPELHGVVGYTPTDSRFLTDAFPLSTLPIAAGQVLHIGGANPEDITVISTDLTQFTANFASAHLATDPITASGVLPRVSTNLVWAVDNPGSSEVFPVNMANIIPGTLLTIDYGSDQQEVVEVQATTASSFTAIFAKTHAAGVQVSDLTVQGEIAANKVVSVSRSISLDFSAVGDTTASEQDIIHLSLLLDDPTHLLNLKLKFDVGDGSYKDFYETQTTATIPNPSPPDPGSIFVSPLTWTDMEVARSSFVANGDAGTPGKNWANVTGYRLEIAAGASGVTIGLDDIYLLMGAGPDSYGGVAYDYRYTYYDMTTGTESSPSVTMAQNKWLIPRRQPMAITFDPSPNPRVTHVRVYRRGGSISSFWYKVAEVPIGDTQFLDDLPDSLVMNNETLELDNDAPVTAALLVPVDTTITENIVGDAMTEVHVASADNLYPNQWLLVGNNPVPMNSNAWSDNGGTEEWVIVQDVDREAGTVTAYFQKRHLRGDRIQAKTRAGVPMHISCQAFQRMWLAGDPNSPNLLYYSKLGQPENFGPQNYVEIGSPSDPIMAITEYRNGLLVMTQNTFYTVMVPAQGQPYPYDTPVKHGLRSTFAWVKFGGMIWYESYDGFYVYGGGAEELTTSALDWLFAEITSGPLRPLDQKKLDETIFAVNSNNLYAAYTNLDGVRKRLIWENIHKRWINDSIAVTAMYFEEDTAQMMLGQPDGNVSIDRQGDSYDLGHPEDEPVEPPSPEPERFIRRTLFTDNFNRPDSNLMGINWTQYENRQPTTLRIKDSKLCEQCGALATAVLPLDQWTQIAYKGPDANVGVLETSWIDLTLRSTIMEDAYEGVAFELDFAANGAANNIGWWCVRDLDISNQFIDADQPGFAPFERALVEGDVLTFEAQGMILRGWVNDIKFFEYDLANYTEPLRPEPSPYPTNHWYPGTPQGTGKAGVGLYGASSLPYANFYGDDFACGDFVVDSTDVEPPSVPHVYAPITFNIHTSYQNLGLPKNAKAFTEPTIDIDTQGQDVSLSLRLNTGQGANIIDLGTVNTQGRRQVALNLNDGKGVEAFNLAFNITGSVTRAVTIWGAHVRALVEAEWRKSLDSYWLRFGTDEWKSLKQGWFEWNATAEITCQVYRDGQEVPWFTFTLPATGGVRKTTRRTFEPGMAKEYRLVATSTGDFRMYPESQLEARYQGQAKGYQRMPLAT